MLKLNIEISKIQKEIIEIVNILDQEKNSTSN